MAGLFITGATGLIGSRLLQVLPYDEYDDIYCLSRAKIQTTTTFSWGENVTFLRGDLFDNQIYGQCLHNIETVIHLAAVTGKATPAEFFTVNLKGTELLLKQCRQAGVRNFLYVSTIAVNYSDKSNYYYAQSKEQSEAAVKESGLNYAIVRPTIVLGENSPILHALNSLAKLPVIPVFGDGQAIIQPIYLDDLVNCMLSILSGSMFSVEIFELGGPERISFEQFLLKLRRQYTGKDKGPSIHLPLKPLQSLLAILEKPLLSMLPITAGQLSAFGNDGTIQENRLFLDHAPRMKTLDEMLDAIKSLSQ